MKFFIKINLRFKLCNLERSCKIKINELLLFFNARSRTRAAFLGWEEPLTAPHTAIRLPPRRTRAATFASVMPPIQYAGVPNVSPRFKYPNPRAARSGFRDVGNIGPTEM